MYLSRNEKIFLQKKNILEVVEKLLIKNNEEVIIDELAKELDIAKGTIYKYFKSKNQLYLELLILNEKRLLEISKNYKYDINKSISEYMLYHMLNSNRTILFHIIEERITSQEKKLRKLFEELYLIREKRIIEIKDITIKYLSLFESLISVRDYLSYVWTITYGASLLLSSTYYKKSIDDRTKLIDFYIKQALNI